MTTSHKTPTVVLIPGYWLGAWAWDDVLSHLNADHTPAIAMTLPGLDADDVNRTTATLDDQTAAIRTAIAQQGDEPVILVAHSGANGPVSLLLDQHPDLVSRVVWVDSGPLANGGAFAPDFPTELTELPLPTFEDLGQQASLEGLSPDTLERFRARAVPEPASVVRQVVTLENEARRSVPTTLVCCSISGEQVLELAEAGHPMFAEVAHLEHVEMIDLPTGHWPMWSKARELADIITSAAAV